jgi:hypothetical protein
MFAHESPGEGFLDLEEADTHEVHVCHTAELRADPMLSELQDEGRF